MQPSGIDVQSAADAVKLIKQAQSVRQGPPQALMFRLPCGKGDKAQNQNSRVVGKTYTLHGVTTPSEHR
jgi:chromosome partitioning protein